MKSGLPIRFTHLAMVALTVVNLLWVDAPSCCCAQTGSCASGSADCCGADRDETGCSCCCKSKAAGSYAGESDAPSCPHCRPANRATATCETATSDVASERSEDACDLGGIDSCGNSGSCNCGLSTDRSTTSPSSTQLSSQSHLDGVAIAMANIEPRMPELRPAVSLTRHNHDLAALERPVSIRFGVWRN